MQLALWLPSEPARKVTASFPGSARSRGGGSDEAPAVSALLCSPARHRKSRGAAPVPLRERTSHTEGQDGDGGHLLTNDLSPVVYFPALYSTHCSSSHFCVQSPSAHVSVPAHEWREHVALGSANQSISFLGPMTQLEPMGSGCVCRNTRTKTKAGAILYSS